MGNYETSRLLTILPRFYQAFQIPVSLCNGAVLYENCSAVSFHPDPALHYFSHMLEYETHEVWLLNRHEILCGLVRISDSPLSVLIGPVRTTACTDKSHASILRDLGQSPSRKQELKHWLEKAPIMDRSHFIALLSLVCTLLNNRDIPVADVDQNSVVDSRSPETTIKMQDVFHNTQQLEKQILQAITDGDRSTLLEILPKVHQAPIMSGTFPGGLIRTLKNLFITSATLCARAAIVGGMDYDYALTLSDNYISKVEMMESQEEIVPQIGMMMTEFCEQTAKLRQSQNCSALTRQIISDVHAHLYAPITIERIAERNHLSVSHITHSFAKDMGQSLKSYIQQQKIEEAKRLLDQGERSTAEVASMLAFSSQSHFQTVFRKITGTTPARYRRRN